jgi:hypothetical protein
MALARTRVVGVLAVVAGPARALELKDCEKTTSMTAQKKCLDTNTKIIAKALTEGIYKKCWSKAQSNGSE